MSEKKDSTSLWIAIIGFSLLILVVLSFFWVNYYSGNAHDYEGKNGKFNFHKLEVSGITFYHISAFFDGTEYLYGFRNHPSDLEDIYLENNVYNKLNKDKENDVIYVTRDSTLGDVTGGRSTLAISAFEQILTGRESIYQFSNLSNVYTTNVSASLPVITCEDVNEISSVIYVKIGQESKIYSQNGCIIIEGKGTEDLIRVSEKFAYHLLGVF